LSFLAVLKFGRDIIPQKKNQTFKAERFSRQYSLFGLRAMLLLLSFVFQPVVTSKQQNYRDNAP